MGRADSLGALRERQFRLLFTGQTVSLLGDSMTPVALAFAVLDLTHSPTDLGFVIAAKTLPLVAFLLVGGVFADRLPRRAVMLAADVTRLGTQAGTATLILTHSAHIWELVILQAVSGTATAFFNPASTGLTPMTVSAERLQQANALRGIAMASTGIAGYALAGVLVAGVGPGWALAGDAASFGVSAFFLAQLRLPAHQTLPPQSFAADLAEGWKEFVSRDWVWVIVVGASIGNGLGAAMNVLGPAVAKASLGGPAAWAAILVAMAVGSLAGASFALRVRPRRPLLVGVLFLWPSVLPTLLLGFPAPLAVIVGGAFVSGLGLMIFNSLWETTLQQHVPAQALSRVSAYDWFGSLAILPLCLAVAGPVSVVIGTRATLWVASGGMALMTMVMLVPASVRRLERLS